MADPKLYILATPLGNRGDITLRAIETLGTLTVLFAEDSRECLKLLEMIKVPAKGKVIHSYAKHNLKEATHKAVEELRKGNDVGLLCDRGTPGISDPGALLVAAARNEGFAVIPIPGPSAPSALLSVSGLSETPYIFIGFPPSEKRAELWEKLRVAGIPFCLFESPKRVRDTLRELAKEFPGGRVLVGREMTKAFEEYLWFDLNEVDVPEKGEFTLLVAPLAAKSAEKEKADWRDALHQRVCSDKEWARLIAEQYDLSVTDVYNALQKEKRHCPPQTL